jgi:hypothetical protein
MSSDSLPPFNQIPASTPGPFTLTQPPHPTWKWGEPVSSTPEGKAWIEQGEKAGWEVLNVDELLKEGKAGLIYPLMISGIVPRPIAFVSSIGTDGEFNLAPFR